MKHKVDYPCWRCEGKGQIRAYSHVLGGVCFKCGGSGKQATRPRGPSALFAVFLWNQETGRADRIYNMRTRASAEAIRAAEHHFANASTMFRDVYTMESAVAVRADELTDPGTIHLDRLGDEP